MSFVSLAFLIFISIVFIIYFVVPKKYQWIVLLLSSFVFYMLVNYWYMLYLIATIVITYLSAIFINKQNDLQSLELNIENIEKEQKKAIRLKFEKKKRLICAFGIIINIGILIVSKYLNFIFSNINGIISLFGGDFSFSFINILMPIGLSFYIFQSLGYLIDVYRGSIECEKNILKYALFVSFFPQLLQGPIGRYDKLAPQLFEEHKLEFENVFLGTQRIILGYFKKIAVADLMGVMVDAIFANPTSAYGIVGLLGAIGYAIQLYADFSGYMDIAIGISKVMGITLDENFDKPYLSKSIAEYWRRWHITLGAWFRDYVHYSLLRSKGLSKIMKSKNKKLGSIISTSIALIIVWVSIGFWHGANWTYVLHGIYYGIIIILSIILEPVYKKIREKVNIKDSKIFGLFQIVRTFLIVCFGYILFRSNSILEFSQYIKAMFSGLGINELIKFSNVFSFECKYLWIYLLQVALSCISWKIMASQFEKYKISLQEEVEKEKWRKQATINCAVMIIIVIASFVLVNSLGGYRTGFLYYEF